MTEAIPEAQAAPARTWLQRLGVAARFALLVVACYIGGVAATNLAPTRVETTNYAAEIRLNPLPSSEGVLHSPTIIGDLYVAFDAPVVAPGLTVTASVREGITDALTAPNLSVRSLQPKQAEIDAAIASAAWGVGLRFVLGAGIIAAVLSAAVHYARGHRPRRQHLWLAGTAFVTAVTLTGTMIISTYRQSRFAAIQTTGVLGTVQRNAGMLEGVEARAGQATPYLRNLLAVSQALQEQYVPAEIAQPVGARFLLVSDIHGVNQYQLMKTIIQEEKIDAVIDTGDLLNFGYVEEGQASAMYSGIESLGVPYVFVTGNHDSTSPTDRALLRRMAKIPNVVLLQEPGGDYVEWGFRGLRITGLNDPRYYGDDDSKAGPAQVPAMERYNLAMKDQPVSDIVAVHEPYALDDLAAGRISLNGHRHSAALTRNQIQMGTFTGGGIFNHFAKDGDQLVSEPYAFDVLTYGTSCQLTQLTRYTFRNLLEGRPAYDTIQVRNGATIDSTVPLDDAGQPRACGLEVPTTSRIVKAPTESQDQAPAPEPTAPSTP